MAVLMVIQRTTELDAVRKFGLLRNNHKFLPPFKLPDAYRTGRKKWGDLRDAIEKAGRIDAVLVAAFYEDHLVTAPYLLAPLRAFESRAGQDELKVGLVAPDSKWIVEDGLTEPVKWIDASPNTKPGAEQLAAEVKQRLRNTGPGPVYFVDDSKGNRVNLISATDVIESQLKRGVEVMDFPDAYEALLAGGRPAAVVADAVEQKIGTRAAARTGLGLHVTIRSSSKLRHVVPILYSGALPTDPNLRASLKPFDEVFFEGTELEKQLDTFLR